MADRSFWFLMLISLSVPVVFSRHAFNYQYYISKYHKVVSTAESASSLTPIVSTAGSESSLRPEDSSSEERISPSESSQTTGFHTNGTLLRGDPYEDYVRNVFIMRVVIIVGSVITFVVVLGCIVWCCPGCCRGRERRGFVVRDARENRATEVNPQQPLVAQPQQQAAVYQHFPPNYSQEPTQQFPAQYAQQPVQQFPPQYPQQPIQQPQYSSIQPQSQYSPTTLQFCNPPEAPPPYDDTPSHKY